MRFSLAAKVVVAATFALVLAGCSASVGGDVLSKAEVEKQALTQLANNVGIPLEKAPKLTCPSDLDAKVGATMTCALGTPPAAVYDVSIKVTSVDSSTKKANFGVSVAKTPRKQ